MTREKIIVRWRDNANPFPGRITEVKWQRLSSAACAWKRFLRETAARALDRQIAEREQMIAEFESFIDSSLEDRS